MIGEEEGHAHVCRADLTYQMQVMSIVVYLLGVTGAHVQDAGKSFYQHRRYTRECNQLLEGLVLEKLTNAAVAAFQDDYGQAAIMSAIEDWIVPPLLKRLYRMLEDPDDQDKVRSMFILQGCPCCYVVQRPEW